MSINELAANALLARKKYRNKNTAVIIDNSGNAILTLYDNKIAVYTPDSRLFVTTAGWNTQTTLYRLHEVTKLSIRHRSGSLLLDGNPWDGRWIEIIDLPPMKSLIKSEPPINL